MPTLLEQPALHLHHNHQHLLLESQLAVVSFSAGLPPVVLPELRT